MSGAERPSGPPSRRGDDSPSRRRDDLPVLPDITEDERDVGWGDDRDGGRRDRDWYERERPPHHE